MRVGKLPYEVLILVCTNIRDEADPRSCCARRGSVEIQEELKRRVKALALPFRARVSRAGCLDLCAEGPNVLVIPPGRLYSGVALADLDAIIDDTFGRFARPPDPIA
jgi:(2Fe-2S) ferredoxin